MSSKDEKSPPPDHEIARIELEKAIHRLRELTAEARLNFDPLGAGSGTAPGPDLPPPRPPNKAA